MQFDCITNNDSFYCVTGRRRRSGPLKTIAMFVKFKSISILNQLHSSLRPCSKQVYGSSSKVSRKTRAKISSAKQSICFCNFGWLSPNSGAKVTLFKSSAIRIKKTSSHNLGNHSPGVTKCLETHSFSCFKTSQDYCLSLKLAPSWNLFSIVKQQNPDPFFEYF